MEQTRRSKTSAGRASGSKANVVSVEARRVVRERIRGLRAQLSRVTGRREATAEARIGYRPKKVPPPHRRTKPTAISRPQTQATPGSVVGGNKDASSAISDDGSDMPTTVSDNTLIDTQLSLSFPKNPTGLELWAAEMKQSCESEGSEFSDTESAASGKGPLHLPVSASVAIKKGKLVASKQRLQKISSLVVLPNGEMVSQLDFV